MKMILRCAALFSPLVLSACHVLGPGPAQAGSPASTAGAKPTGEKLGVLAPRDAKPLALWPEAYSGSWVVLEVLPHGSVVKQGDVVARCETRAIEDELHRAELELHSAEIAHQGLLERGQLEKA